MKRRILGFILSITMLIGVIIALPVYTSAADVWDGTSSEAFSGDGTKNSPFVIANGKQLKYLQEQVFAGNTYNGKYIVLANDIDLGGKEWTPIGGRSGNTPFSGVFDGKGFTVKGLSITEYKMYSGLFGVISPTVLFDTVIANLTVEGSFVLTNEDEFTGGLFIGGIVGYTDNESQDDRVVITNCVSKVIINIDKSTTGTQDPYVGGITGRGKYTDFIDCVTDGSIDIKLGGAAKVLRVGGMVGANYNCTYTNCVNYSNVNAFQDSTDKRADFIGGIIGVSATSSNSIVTTITNCANYGDITSENTQPKRVRVGGIIGSHYYNCTTIENTYNTGKISGKVTDTVGIDPTEYCYVGGITGHFDKEGGVNSIIIKNCYNSGELVDAGGIGGRVGGIVGEGITYPENPIPSKISGCKTTTSTVVGYSNDGLVESSDANITLTDFNALIVNIDAAIATGAAYDFDAAIKYLDLPVETTTVKQETTAKPETTVPSTTVEETEPIEATTATEQTDEDKKEASCGCSSTSLVAVFAVLGGVGVFVFTKKKF